MNLLRMAGQRIAPDFLRSFYIRYTVTCVYIYIASIKKDCALKSQRLKAQKKDPKWNDENWKNFHMFVLRRTVLIVRILIFSERYF